MDSPTPAALFKAAARRQFRSVTLLLLLPLMGGCTAAGYYWQGIRGQFDLLERARPIPDVLATSEDPALKRKLERVLAIREYASRELALPDNRSYRTYTDLGRRFVLWNVFAAPELSLEPRQWCFPIAGCVNYRGYFDEAAARTEASRFAATGDDVYVGGVPAYSTLGYFNDPMLSSVIRYPDTEVARLIFHELAHQVAYAKDDTVFNESFAVTVEEEGVGRWLAAQNDPALTAQFNTSQRYRDGFRTLIGQTRSELLRLYTSRASDDEKRAGKAAAFAAMRVSYEALKKDWGGFAAYDGWFAAGPNNANLAAVGLYTQKVPEFHALLAVESGDLRRFYTRVKALAALPKGERDSALAAAVATNRTAATTPSRAPLSQPPG
jgi:predicted aminopeptidase